MKEFLLRNLHGDVEGTCSGKVGFIICVLTVTNISPGKVLPGSGLAEFVVQYQAIVFKPYKGEVVDAIVTSVNQVMSYIYIHFAPSFTKELEADLNRHAFGFFFVFHV